MCVYVVAMITIFGLQGRGKNGKWQNIKEAKDIIKT